jgi:hypothetical protein
MANTNDAQPTNLPLFFVQPMPLDGKRHAQAGLVANEDAGFSVNTNSIPLNAVEFVEAAKHYPIVFTDGDDVVPVAIVGLEQQNYFVGAKGRWEADAYIPAYVRRYPFTFMLVEEKEEFVLCVDEKSPQFREKLSKGVLPFFEDGKPASLSTNAMAFCTEFQKQMLTTREFCAALKAADLLSPTSADVKLASNGRDISLKGFNVIDEAKFQKLSAETLAEWHKKGWLALAYFSLLSSSNWNALVKRASLREAA